MKKSVEIGQLYQAVGKASGSWRVAKLVDQSGILHARLVSTDNNRDQRLMACSVVLDPARYRLTRDIDARYDNEAAE
jgi:hypothetical protein